jgi:hypothetical protein
MDIIGSALTYLGSIIGLVVGVPVLGYLFFATPHSPTSLGNAVAATKTEPMLHKATLSRPPKIGGRKELTPTAQLDRANGAGEFHYAVGQVPTTHRQKSRGPILRDREKEWAYHHDWTGFSRRASYAQDLSGDVSGAW